MQALAQRITMQALSCEQATTGNRERRLATRIYCCIVLMVILGTAWQMARQFGWVGGPSTRAVTAAIAKAGAGGTYHKAHVPPTHTVDIDTGNVGRAGADLHWGMHSRGEPYLAGFEGGMLARLGGVAWEEATAAHLGKLNYAPAQFLFRSGEPGFRLGDVIAVRTGEGRLAKLRIVSLRRDYGADTEWVLYPPPTDGAQAPAHNPYVGWTAKRDAALAAYRGGDLNAALRLCGEGIDIAVQAGVDSAIHAYALIRCGEMMRLHSLAPTHIEDWLLRGLSIAEKLGQERITAELGSPESGLIRRGKRMLSLLHREQGAALDALRDPRRGASNPATGGKAE